MRLLDMVMAGNFNLDPRAQDTKWAFRTLAKEAFAVDANNVNKWLTREEEEGELKPLPDLAPLFKLPFPVMWFEYEDDENGLIGVLFAERENVNEIQVVGGVPAGAVTAVQGELFCRYPGMRAVHVVGLDIWVDAEFQIMSEIGMVVGRAETQEEALELADHLRESGMASMAQSCIVPACASVSFFHCKNVDIRKVHRPQSEQRKLRRKEKHQPVPSFHVIEVHKRTVHGVHAGDDNRSDGKFTRASFIRGHFKKYLNEGEKLFGKHKGVWWWQMRAQGDGAPLKSEYRTWPPEGRHTKTCIVQPEVE